MTDVIRAGDSEQPPSNYKWIALSNTTLGAFMAFVNSNVIVIALPAIFNGIGVDPLAPGETNYFLWLLLGYMVVTATLLVTLGRLSDMFGRVRLYTVGFGIFTVGSILLFLAPGNGNPAALELILLRLVQAIGASLLIANSTAILTDAFPIEQRGTAMGINQIATIAGSFVGLIVGGLLAGIHWRLVFLVSVPIGLLGTIWSYRKLRETATARAHPRIDWPGNITFALGLIVFLVGITYVIEPYAGAPMGWGNPLIIGAMVLGLVLLTLFCWIELRAPAPMFRLELFGIRMFSAGILSTFLSSLARGGLQFMLIIWLQGIWLPLHGYDYAQTPLWAGIFMSPLLAGLLIMGPISGWLSDRFGSRFFSTAGMLVQAVGFIGLTFLPADFSYVPFALLLLVLGMGSGLFVAPNTTAIMNSVPADSRGVASGMRATFQNAASVLSIGVFFTIVIGGLAGSLPQALYAGLIQNGVPASSAEAIAQLPPTSALFGAFLGYNPIGVLLPPLVQQELASTDLDVLLSKTFFPNLIAQPFLASLRTVFYVGAAMCALGAAASALRGRRQIGVAAAATPALEPQPIAGRQVRVVTISRQYGSGGGEIGTRLARRMGWELLDHGVVERVAAALKLTVDEAKVRDERHQSFFASLVAGARALEPSLLDDGSTVLADLDTYALTVRSVIESAANIGDVIVIGRGGQVLLAGRPDVLHVRVLAPPEQRIAYVAYREQHDTDAARRRVQAKDQDRDRYLHVVHGRSPDDPRLYDLVINTGSVDLDTVVDEIHLALERKGHRQRTPGPPDGVAPYPAEPRDFPAVTSRTA